MNFDSGFGDFLAMIKLAAKLRKDFSDAPNQLQVILDEVKSLIILLSENLVHWDTIADKLYSSWVENLSTVVEGSAYTLWDLEGLLTSVSSTTYFLFFLGPMETRLKHFISGELGSAQKFPRI